MRILLTNDDGIYSEGIYAIYSQLKKLGEVDVVAPDSQKSAVSHTITLAHPIFCRKVDRKGSFFGYGISGTPADCVKFALNIICEERPDLIVSGINLGPNDGASVHYSGTVAGAREGALNHIPSVAVSLGTFVNPKFDVAAQCATRVIKQVIKTKLPKGTFLNINVPSQALSRIKGYKVTRQGTRSIHGTFKKRQDPNARTYYWNTGIYPTIKNDDLSDTYHLNKDYVTITPVQCDTTNMEMYHRIKDWKIV